MPLALTAVPGRWLRGREYLLLKKHFDVFTNPNTEPLLEALAPDEVVVFGVATSLRATRRSAAWSRGGTG